MSLDRHKRFACIALGVAISGFGQHAAHALVFNLTFDSSTTSAPADFFSDLNLVAQFYQTNYNDPITINLQVGWGLINGSPLTPGNIGQSSTLQKGPYNFNTIKNALLNDSQTPDDATAVTNLPITNTTGTAPYLMSNAEAKALGLLAGDATGLDGYVGFDKNASYTFDPNNRAVASTYDFIGLAHHEMTEIMGRYGLGQNGGSSGRYSPIDLFRYFSPTILDLIPANGSYFSINNGNTTINTFNGTGGGDLSDWSGLTADAYNAHLSTGVLLAVSPGDLTLMDVIGYDRVPEPASLAILGLGMLGVMGRPRGSRDG